MVGIQGLGGVPEPKSGRPDKLKNERDAAAQNAVKSDSGQSQDAVRISSEAQAAAELSRLVQLAQDVDDVRLNKVEAAREHIANGDYKKPEVVRQVADQILKHIS